MLKMLTMLLFTSMTVLAGTSLGSEPEKSENSECSRCAKMIAEAFSRAKDQPAAEQLETFQAVAKVVSEKCPDNALVMEQLQAAHSREALEAALQKSYDMLSFRMEKEADLPSGFPNPTPVGEIQVKQYPAHRLARTASQEDSGFFKLFAHITVNRVAMTAPVEMTYQADDKNGLQQIDMAFIYGDKKLGKAGEKLGGITVQDIPALMTVSIGLKGNIDSMKAAEAEQRLERWLAQRPSEYERAGNLRVLGYNSPQVPVDSRYFEVELPIKKK